MKPSNETLIVLNGLRTEIVAGKVMFPQSLEDKAWNNCADRAIRILDRYKEGEGLFQQKTEKKELKENGQNG